MYNRLTAYQVCYSESKTVLSDYAERKTAYWSQELLAKRLNNLKYAIHKAELVILTKEQRELVEK